jgi:hypothetical protein
LTAPVQRFLSDAEPLGGPFALLGIEPGDVDDARVNAALLRQLARVAAHPLGATPEAEEVRLALHVAAAQLRDPAVRRALMTELATRPASRHAGAAITSPSEPAALTAAEDPLRPRVLAVLAMSGGWNSTARVRLAALAIAQGRDPAQVMALASQSPAVGLSGAPSITPPPSALASPHRVAIPSVRTRRRRVLLGAAMVLMVIVSFVLARAVMVISPPPSARQEMQAAESSADGAPESVEPGRGVSPGSAPTLPGATTSSSPLAATATPAPIVEPRGTSALRTPSRGADVQAPIEPANTAYSVRRRTGGVISRWESAALLAIARNAGDRARDQLAHAVGLARLNAAASSAWLAHNDDAERLITSAESAEGLPALLPDPPDTAQRDAIMRSLTAPGAETDGQLALEINAARRQPGAALESLGRRRYALDPLGPADCDAVAAGALFGSPLDLRLICRKIAIDQKTNPVMIHAVLEALPKAAAQRPVSEIVEELTGRRLPLVEDPAWPTSARAALVARLAELLAQDDADSIDSMAGLLIGAYEAHSSELAGDMSTPAAPAPTTTAPASESPAAPAAPIATPGALGDADQVLGRVWGRWRQIALEDPRAAGDVQRLSRRRELRMSLASGVVQRFIAGQASNVELMALVVRREQPSLEPRVNGALERAAAQQRRAATAAAQIAGWERATAELWLLRFGNTQVAGESHGAGGPS